MAVWSSLEAFAPQLVLVAFALLMPALDYLFKDKRLLALAALAPLLGVGAAVLSWTILGIGDPPVSQLPLVQVDMFSGLFMLVFLAVGVIVVLASPEFIRNDRNQGEYYALVLLAITGMTVVAESTDLIALFVGLEIAGISSFALAGFRKSENRSSEAATKYFIVGGFSSALTLFAISLFYGAAGTTEIAQLGPRLEAMFVQFEGTDSLVLLATVLFLAGIGFKIAMVPFHMWAPDVYEGAPIADIRPPGRGVEEDGVRGAVQGPPPRHHRDEDRLGHRRRRPCHSNDDRRATWSPCRRPASSACWHTRPSPRPATY